MSMKVKRHQRSTFFKPCVCWSSLGTLYPLTLYVKNCFRKAGVSQETQVASINEEDDPFKLLQQNVDELKSRDLVDENLTVDDYVDIDFQVTTSETSAMTDQEILDSILINDLAEEEEEETEEESSDIPPRKAKIS